MFALRTLAAVAVGLLALPAVGRAAFLTLDPRATYLRTSSDSALPAPAVDLFALGFNPGSVLLFEQVGDWRARADFPDTATSLTGVFSSSPTLLASGMLNRVPGAIDAGTDRVTPQTFSGGLPTDIPEDFAIAENPPTGPFAAVVTMPAGARYLFLSPVDVLFGDNSDPDGDYGVRITALAPSQATPAPGGLAVFAVGGLGVAVAARRRRPVL